MGLSRLFMSLDMNGKIYGQGFNDKLYLPGQMHLKEIGMK